MATPVPKPRTKFNNQTTPEENGDDPPQTNSEFPASPSIQMLAENGRNVPDRPIVPPRPPTKPPRAIMVPTSTTQKFGDVLGELKVNIGEENLEDQQKKEPIYEQLNITLDDFPIISPSRAAPPPPRPPPPAGWRSDVIGGGSACLNSPIPPPVPERGVSNIDRPLPELPIDENRVEPRSIANPMYLSLNDFRELSRSSISPIPSDTTSFRDECDKVKEWLSEEEDDELTAGPSNATTCAPLPPSTNVIRRSRDFEEEDEDENPYTPCPRRSDFSSSEFSDPFDATLFPTSSSSYRGSTSSSKNQNIYVSHQDMKEYAVVEVCSEQEEREETQTNGGAYVNIGLEPIPSKAERSPSVYNESWNSRDLTFLSDGGQPQINGSTVTFVGYGVLTSGRKDKRLNFRLKDMKLGMYEDDECNEMSGDPISVNDFVMFRKAGSAEIATTSSPSPSSSTSTDANYIKPYIIIGQADKRRPIISFCPEESASVWLYFISEAWLSVYPELSTVLVDAADLLICGNIWIKRGAIGEWAPAIAGINGKSFYYIQSEARDKMTNKPVYCEELIEIDMRKVITLKSKTDKSDWCPNVKHKRGPFLMALNGLSIYIDSKDETITNNWYEAIDGLLKKTSNKLEDCRLTSDDIPVIVDKCIRYVTTHGIKSDGIYRKNGKMSESRMILAKLMEDPLGYHIIEENSNTVDAVADVVRTFFRKLNEPLISKCIHQELFDADMNYEHDEMIEKYEKTIEKLPKINYATLKKLIAHLKHVADNSEENKATVDNLAKVFAPSLFNTNAETDEDVQKPEILRNQGRAMVNIIKGYDKIFRISFNEEISRQMFKEAEQRCHKTVYGKKLMVPIHMWEKENRPFNVETDLASEEVCRGAIAKRGFDAPTSSPYALFEILMDGQLIRRLPAFEKLSSSVLRWLDWGLTNGYILFDHDRYNFNGDDASSFTGKVKIAECGSKTFKSYEMKIEKGESVCVFRNDKLWKTWPLATSLWFVGAENARKAPNQYNATMLSSLKDGYSGRYAGYCVSFKDEQDRVRWLNAVTYAQTGGNSESLVYI